MSAVAVTLACPLGPVVAVALLRAADAPVAGRAKLTVAPALAYCDAGSKQLLTLRNSFIERNVELLVDAVSADCKSGPVLMPQIH